MLTRTDGAILVSSAALYTAAIIRGAWRESRAVKAEFAAEYKIPRGRSPLIDKTLSAGALIVGIAVVITGADWLVDGAVQLAAMMGVSDAFIGLTIVAIGTSSPELVTTVVSTLRQQRDIAVGNLIGSSVYNILLILGATALIPVSGIMVEPDLVRIDIPVMLLVTVVCIPVFISGRRLSRAEGALFVGLYLIYLTYLVLSQG